MDRYRTDAVALFRGCICPLIVGAIVCLSSKSSAQTTFPTHYHIIAIPSPKGYTTCSPVAVNNHGAVIGRIAPEGFGSVIVLQSFVFTGGNVSIFPKPWFFALNEKDMILGRDGETDDPATKLFDIQGKPTGLPDCPNMWPKLLADSGLIAGDSTGKETSVTSSVLPFTYTRGKVTWYPSRQATPAVKSEQRTATRRFFTAMFGRAIRRHTLSVQSFGRMEKQLCSVCPCFRPNTFFRT